MANDLEIRLLDTEWEQTAVLPLLALCFPAYWEQTAAKNRQFPFEELSFGALENGRLVGHYGVIPQRMSMGNGQFVKVAGVASVAVLPECRGRGIASRLGNAVRDWAQRNGYEMMSLYTDKSRVYQVAGFADYISTPAQAVDFGSCGSCVPLFGSELTDGERQTVIHLYEAGEDYKGRLCRGAGREFHGWSRLFRDPDYKFAVGQGIYAIFYDGVLAECCFAPQLTDDAICAFIARYALSGKMDVALHSESRVWKALADIPRQPCLHDIMHGEHPMILPLQADLDVTHIHFNLTDKF